MATLLSGKEARDAIAESLVREIKALPSKLRLTIIQIGSRPDSNSYIRQKKLFAEKIGAEAVLKQYPESVEEAELLSDISDLNKDKNIHGIILQLPIPVHLNKDNLIESIDPKKDVDGLTGRNTKLLYGNKESGLMPATARGIVSLLEYFKISIEGKRVTVVGRSQLVGKAVALALLNKNATVTITHRYTKNLADVCREADILVIAIGQPEFITKDFVKKDQVVIDVGINDVNGKLVGDVKYEEVAPIVSAITPVPGGVGPMTVVSLFQNLLQAYLQQNK